ncbi:MAG: Hpt domain-containing protein [Myxococcota bacterium]
MAGFSIDDVRESFTKDISSFIAQIDEATKALVATKALDVSELCAGAGKRLDKVADAGHSIAGTSSLVGVGSIANTARLIEELVAKGQSALATIAAQAARARHLAGLCKDGAGALSAMLELELAGKRDEAQAIAERWEAKVLEPGPGEPAPAAPPTTGKKARPGRAAEEFDFEDEVATSDADAGDELAEAFRQEAREGLVTLQGYLQLLSNQPDDHGAAVQVERIFHTLKGASAAVGLSEVNRRARTLQHTMESVVSGDTKVTTRFLDDLVQQTNDMLTAAGVPTLAPLADARRARGARGAALLRQRSAPAHRRRARLTPQLATASVSRARVRGELGRLFHRLKGSALLVNEREIARGAADLQALCEGRAANVTQVDLQLAAIEGLLGRMVLSPQTGVMSRVHSRPSSAPEPVAQAPLREAVSFVGGAELWESFELECPELLDGIVRGRLRHEHSERPQAELEALMRLYHTLKGALNTVGLAPVGRSVHLVEDFLEKMGALSILPPMRNVETLLSEVQKSIRKNLSQARQGFVETAHGRLEASLAALLRGQLQPLSGGRRATSESGSERGSAESSRGSEDGQGEVVDQATDIERRFLRVSLERLDALMNLAGELVVSRSRLLSRVGALRGLQTELGRSRKRLVDTVDRFRAMYEFANLDGRGQKAREADATPAALAGRRGAAGAASPGFAVAAATFGAFGELELDRYDDVHVLARSLAEIASDADEIDSQVLRELGAFGYDSESFSGIVSGIQSEVTRARMVPLAAMFTRLRLTARDVAEREQKRARVETVGEEVSLDKTMADALFGPMLHLARNAVGHGIEAPERRTAVNKDPEGLITLNARQESGQIVIEVSDDGAGLDLPRLHQRGVALGLIKADVPLDDPAVKDLVFARGLSTRAEAGDVSGRGIGGDVVRRAVERLNGTVRVSSTPGAGTTFRVTVPLTLAITRAILVKVGEQSYAVPLYFADRIVAPDEVTIVESAGIRRLGVDGSFQPLRGLGELFGVRGAVDAGPILVLRVGDQRMGLQVDRILGQEEIVVKGLGEILTGHPLFAGMTIRGNGELVLILDVLNLIESRSRAGDDGALDGDTIDDGLEVGEPAAAPARAPGAPAAPAASRVGGQARGGQGAAAKPPRPRPPRSGACACSSSTTRCRCARWPSARCRASASTWSARSTASTRWRSSAPRASTWSSPTSRCRACTATSSSASCATSRPTRRCPSWSCRAARPRSTRSRRARSAPATT